MARIVDITDKLMFEENPALIIKGKKLEINADAPTMLKIMQFMGVEGIEVSQIHSAYELIFPEKSRKEIDKLKLSTTDWMTVVQEAMKFVIGEDHTQGE